MVDDIPVRQSPVARALLGGVKLIGRPGELALALRIGRFLWTIPRELEREPMPRLLARLRAASRPRASDAEASLAMIARLRQAWLRLAQLRAYDTCYTRAFTLYRFIDPCGGALHIHLGVEPGIDPGDRLRGHAWVTLDGRILEPPPAVVEGRVREIYCHPAQAAR
ncbi:MAG TPA: lasso peptide biosynthesis B2 protein [Candidatus Bathyarchaeia archaeon]|nr:lasso peptide biosynthesis B2 protein [Candidatus Bathyarchaeia archaeon]